jgi:hypothetical protein
VHEAVYQFADKASLDRSGAMLRDNRVEMPAKKHDGLPL